jgi:two-component system response regulator CssR
MDLFHIFLVEDEANLNQVLATYLEREGWAVQSFFDGESALNHMDEHPHLWILDVMLPDIDGFQVLQRIKKATPGVPVIFISARDADYDRIMGLEMGSDDYIAKPFLPRELVVRTRRLLERAYPAAGSFDTVINVHPYLIDEGKREARIGQERIELTAKEYDLVLLFSKNRGIALSREQIISHIWGEDYVGTDRSVDDLIRRIRKKMPEIRIETIYGFGYRMTAQ